MTKRLASGGYPDAQEPGSKSTQDTCCTWPTVPLGPIGSDMQQAREGYRCPSGALRGVETTLSNVSLMSD